MYRNAIPDIPAGSTWIGEDGARAIVRTAAASHVVYTRETGARPLRLEVVHANDFRAAWAAIYDRAAIRSQFSMSLANLGEFRVFWLPEQRRIMCRSVSCRRHFAIPDGALEVGTFANPCKSDAFFEALDEVIRAQMDEAARKARAA